MFDFLYKILDLIKNFIKTRHVIINDRIDGEPYLERYYLFLKTRQYFPFNIFLHKFLKSDLEDLHDHPWPYFTLILKGGYWEHISNGLGDKPTRIWRGPGHFRFSHANSLHRIELNINKNKEIQNCWTLFIPGPKLRKWGFDVNGKWIDNEKYSIGKKV